MVKVETLSFATQPTGQFPEAGDQPEAAVTQTAVVGMGTMGTGIAHALLQSGVPVIVLDQDAACMQRGLQRIRGSLEKRIAEGRLAREQAERMLGLVTTAHGWEDLARADLVIECVFEEQDVKRAVLERLEQVCAASTILATNTSTLSLDELAAGMRHPERLIGLHFFNPAQRMPLVEVIRREATPPAVVAAVLELAKRLQKTPVIVRNRAGFIVNRILLPYLQEALALLEEGVPAAAIDAAATDFGFPMGPLTLIDLVGVDILVHAQRVLQRAFPHHGPLSDVAARLVARGCLGQKSGAGVFRYEPGSHVPHASETTAEIIAAVQQETRRSVPPPDPSEVSDRLVLRMVNEAFYVLEEGIAQTAADLDVALVLGTGFPDFRGGVVKYAHDLGLSRVRARLEELAGRCGARFAPGPWLVRQCC